MNYFNMYASSGDFSYLPSRLDDSSSDGDNDEFRQYPVTAGDDGAGSSQNTRSIEAISRGKRPAYEGPSLVEDDLDEHEGYTNQPQRPRKPTQTRGSPADLPLAFTRAAFSGTLYPHIDTLQVLGEF